MWREEMFDGCSRGVCILGVLIWLAGAGAARAVEEDSAAAVMGVPVGERIVSRLYWGAIPVGSSRAETRWVRLKGRRLLGIRVRTRTNRIVKRIYPVDDVVETLVDPETFLPVRFEKKLSEGRYRCHEVTVFDHEHGVARWQSLRSGRRKEYSIRKDTRDLLSFMYYLRTRDFEVGRSERFEVMADEKLYELSLDVERSERVRTLDGKRRRCMKIEPHASFRGIFVHKGRMWVWVTQSKPHLLARMAVRVPVASVKMILEKVTRVPQEEAVRMAAE